jgi:protein gp37
MSGRSLIEWTDKRWNPVRGCTKVSPGCKHCYAETFAERFRGVPGHPYEAGFDVRLVPSRLEVPLGWKTPSTIFVNSMSDLFQEDVPSDFILEVFDVMRRAHWHRFQVLTKRAGRMAEMDLPWPPNAWAGVSVESPEYFWRINQLRRVKAHVRFLSLEPLLEAVPGIDLRLVDWVIVGGESGPGARYLDPDWVRHVRARCQGEGIPFFFKQWGGPQKAKTGRILDGKTWDEMPAEGSHAS